MRKRFLSFILVLCLSISFIGMSNVLVSADSNGLCGENITWSIDADTKTLYINGYGRMHDYFEHTNKAPWHKHLGDIYSVIISDGVSSIGNFAFHECGNISTVSIGSNVEDIGENAFDGCIHLKTIVIPNSVKKINDHAFHYCGFTDIKIPDSVSTIGQCTFEDCIHLCNIEIGNNVRVIKPKAFYNTGYVTGGNQRDGIVYIGNYLISCFVEELGENISVQEGTLCIAEHAFDMAKIKTLETPESLKYIGKGSFEGCDLERVSLNEGLVEIGDYAFSMNDFQTINIPSSVTKIGRSAFEFCRKLEKVSLGSNIVSIDDCAFYYCENITDISYQGNQEMWSKITIGSLNYFLTNNEIIFTENPSNEISIILDGKPISFDQPPIIVDGRTLVPIRAIFEALGATVDWNNETQTVTSVKDDITISMTIGDNQMYKNGVAYTLDVPPQLVGGRTLVPARAVAEAFGCDVDWVNETQTVMITTINKEKIINTAKYLYEANEQMGGMTILAEYAKIDAMLHNVLNDIDVTLGWNDFTLDMVSAGTKATIATAQISAGNYKSIDSLGDGLNKLLTSTEIADAADDVLKDAIKQKIFNEISSAVPDINTFVLGLGRDAYDNNSKLILDMIKLHSKFKSNNYTYEDAVAYIVLHDTLVMNRKTLSMAVEVLSDELPENFLESLAKSAEASAKAVLSSLFGEIFSGRDISISAELFTDIVSAYADYSCGEGVDFFNYMRKINHPTITEWANEVEAYNENLSKKLSGI